MNEVIRCHSVTFRDETQAVVAEVDLTIELGTTVAIMGASGSGKSVLLKLMAGVLTPHSGRVEIAGWHAASLNGAAMAKLQMQSGFVFQDSALWQNLTAQANLTLASRYHYGPKAEAEALLRVKRLCRKLDFDVDLSRRPTAFSAGARKVLANIRALLQDPAIVFLDDPRSGVDTERSERLLDLYRELKRAGKTLIFAGSDPEIVSQLADRVVILDAGRVIADATLSELTRTEDQRVRRVLSAVLDESASYDGDILAMLQGEIDEE